MGIWSYASYRICVSHVPKQSKQWGKKIECKLMLRSEHSDNYKLGIKCVIRKRLLTLYLCKLNGSNSHHMSFFLKVICPDSMIQVSQGLTSAALT